MWVMLTFPTLLSSSAGDPTRGPQLGILTDRWGKREIKLKNVAESF